jgi:hypothetical protein
MNTEILSKTLQKKQKKTEEESEWDRTSPSKFKEPDSDEEDEEDKPLSGKKLLMKIYGGCGACSGEKERTKKVYKKVLSHLEGHLNEPGTENETGLTLASKAPKTNPIWKWSNPTEASKRAKKMGLTLYLSSNPEKKYQILTPEGKWVKFGASGYEDFLKHRDPERRKDYLRRAFGIKGNWKKDPFSPNWLAISCLW